MLELNPYARFLDSRPVAEILAASPAVLASLVEAIGPVRIAHSPAPGKWSPAEIIGHLADCEVAFAFRLRQTLAEDHHLLQPFDQDKWAEPYPRYGSDKGAAVALAAFAALRRWNILLIGAVLAAAADKPVTHPERGTMTFTTIIETMAGHDLNHILQLQKLNS